MARLRRDHGKKESRDIIKIRLFRELSLSDFVSKFRNLTRVGELEDLSEYLETLKKILRKDFPGEGEMEKYVSKNSKVRERYEEAAGELGAVPELAEPRKVYLRIAGGPKHEAYRGRAERILAKIEAIESLAGKIEKLKPYTSRRTPTGLPARLLRPINAPKGKD